MYNENEYSFGGLVVRLNERRSRNDFSARNWFEREFVRWRIVQLLFSPALPRRGNRLSKTQGSLSEGAVAAEGGD